MTAIRFPLAGHLVDGRSAYRWIVESIEHAVQPIDICSAYLRSEALAAMLQRLPKDICGRALVRWRLADLLVGASDIDAHDVARSYGIQLYMRLDFHGKAYSVPPKGVLVSSANATLSGLGIAKGANEEICTLVDSSQHNQELIDTLYEGATKVDDTLLLELKSVLARASDQEFSSAEWPDLILSRLLKPRHTENLFVDECLWSAPDWLLANKQPVTPDEIHDVALLGLLGMNGDTDLLAVSLKNRLVQTAVYSWLFLTLSRSGGEAFFGQLSEALHSALLDDPAPTRRGVKELLQNLLRWVTAFDLTGIFVDRPRHSQRVRLVSHHPSPYR